MPKKLTFVYTDIGRGHPYYLDGIMEALIRRKGLGCVRGQTNVFKVSHGLSLLAWKAVRGTYRKGASDGLAGKIYARLRHGADYNRPSLMLSILGSDIRRYAENVQGPIVVAHPILVAILKDRQGVIYQHGELASPVESIVRGAEYVFVPTEHAAEPFWEAGYSRQSVVITGLCIEPALERQAEEAYKARLTRINGQIPLTGAYFSSGAEPKAHVNKLVNAAGYAIASGGRAILFVARDGRFLQRATSAFKQWQIDYSVIDSSEYIPAEGPSALIIKYSNRRELDIFTARLFSVFDYLVAPSHERTNWALGLGLPMFVVGPCYGPFAPLNRQILLDGGVARDIDEVGVVGFGKSLRDLRQHGYLSEMVQGGRPNYETKGFESIASFLVNYCG